MFKHLIKILIGLFFIPICVGASLAFYELLGSIHSVGKSQSFFIWGILSYCFIHLLLFQLEYLYVVGHEAVHAIFTWLFGGQVKSFKASKKSGSVQTTKTNFIISLAPYFFPFYTVILFLIFLILQIFVKDAYRFTSFFIFLVGFTLSFHVIMTAQTLRIKQPDLAQNGYLFSLAFIYLVNVLVLVVFLSFIFEGMEIFPFIKDTYVLTRELILRLWQKLFVV